MRLISFFTAALVFVMALGLAAPLSAQWHQVFSTPGQDDISSVYFQQSEHAPLTGFIGSYLGAIWRTTDGGGTWSLVRNAGSSRDIVAFAFADSLNGWAVGHGDRTPQHPGVLLRTADGGLTWHDLNLPNTYSDIYYHKATGLLFRCAWDSAGGVFASSDIGASWTQIGHDSYNGFAFTDDMHGVLSVLTGTWLATSDGGHTWHTIPMQQECWQPVAVAGTSTILAQEELKYDVWRSDDNGSTWRIVFSDKDANAPGVGTGMLLTDGCGTIYSQGIWSPKSGGIATSSDLGNSWTAIGGPGIGADTRFALSNGSLYAGGYNPSAMLNALYRFDPIPARLTLSAPSVSDDTLGSIISLPVMLDRSAGDNFADFTVSYDTSELDFMGSSNLSDVLTRTGPGHTSVHITFDPSSPSDTVTQLLFQALPGFSNCGTVTLDSLDVSTSRLICTPQAPIRRTICVPHCTQTLARYLRTHAPPVFRIEGNPARDRLLLVSARDASDVQIAIMDQRGILRRTDHVTARASSPISVALDGLPSGSYHAQVVTSGMQQSIPFVIGK